MTDGLLVVNKPAGMTSHDVVGRLRRIVKQKRIGHAGTLDPNATGVLLVGLGRATRLMTYLSELRKCYTAEVVLGRSTSTLDADGDTVAIWDMSSVELVDVQIAAGKFVGDIEQIPPMVSAVKINGKRLYELARQGIEVDRRPRPVSVYRLDVSSTPESGVFAIDVECSSGTYVRSLAADIGEVLGGGAHLRNLVRTSIGAFDLSKAHDLDALEQNWADHVISPADMIGHLERVKVDLGVAAAISHGQQLSRAQLGVDGDGPWAVLDKSEALLAVYKAGRSNLTAAVVLAGN
jgi:tRNA pseudouridine55 synthase